MKLPLELLKEKYIPIEEFPKKYSISVAKIKSLIDSGRLKYTEFRAPGDIRLRTIHVNPDDVFRILEEDK